ncbi:hypothetical protein ACK36E_09190 [Aeromonas veronii]
MEAQTLQQQVPVYHVCQQCNGAGCQACSDLCILDGEIQLDPEFTPEYVDELYEWADKFCDCLDLLSELSPINGVIGNNPAWKPAYEYIVVWKEDGKPYNKCFTNEADSLAHFDALLGRVSSLYMLYPDGESRIANLVGASK